MRFVALFLRFVSVFLISTNLAAFAAATAFGSKYTNDFVPWIQGVSPGREKIPGLQYCRQPPRSESLQHIDHHDADKNDKQRYAHAYQHLPASQWQAEDEEWEKKEAEDDVDSRKPTIGGSDVPQFFSQPDRYASDGDWIP